MSQANGGVSARQAAILRRQQRVGQGSLPAGAAMVAHAASAPAEAKALNVRPSGAARTPASGPQRVAVSHPRPAAAAEQGSVRQAAVARRAALLRGGSPKSGRPSPGQVRAEARRAQVQAAPASQVEAVAPSGAVSSTSMNESSNRAASARRVVRRPQPNAALALHTGRAQARVHRSAQVSGRRMVEAQRARVNAVGSRTRLANPGADTRELARLIRNERCARGRCGVGSMTPMRPPRERVVALASAPAKVVESETLSGSRVTGTPTTAPSALTGVEAGACRAVTGTEYLGGEAFDALCAARPKPAPAKVMVGETARGQSVSGNQVGASERITGNETGACRAVTGTEYLPADAWRGQPPGDRCGHRQSVSGDRGRGRQSSDPVGATGGDAGGSARSSAEQGD